MITLFIVGSLAAVIAGLAQSSIGFGMAMIMSPCVMLVLEPVAVVPTILLVNILNSLLVTWRYWHHVQLKSVLPLAVGGIVGFTIGIQVLLYLNPNTMRLLVGLFVLTFTTILWRGWRRPVEEKPWITMPIGVVSGFAGGTTSMSGPPVILFLANQGHERDHFRATLIAYFTIINVYGIIRFFTMGALTSEVLTYAGALIPATLAGTTLGILYGGRIPEKTFKNLIFILLAFIGATLVYNSLRS